MCVVPAALLAACSLGDDDGGESGPTTDAATTSEAASDDGSTDGTSSSVADDTSTSGAESGTDAPSAAGSGPISFASQIEPIIERSCANCHTGSGPGTQHVRLDNASLVSLSAPGLAPVIETGFMPPWPAGGDSPEYQHDWSLTTDEIATLLAWTDAGGPLDVPDDHVIEPPPDGGVRLDDPDLDVLSRGSYDGTAGQPDEYRCFVYDMGLDEGGYITAMDFRPQREQVVHHAVGFLVDAADVADFDEVDGADGQGGWTCFGFSPSPTAELVYAWAPGQAANRYPDGTGLRVEAGDVFVIQTHYHFDVEAPPDQSSFELDVVVDSDAEADDMIAIDVSTYLGPAEIPCTSDESGPLCDRNAAVADAVSKYGEAGFFANGILAICGQSPDDYADMTDGIASSTCDQRVDGTGSIIGIFGHQHELGSSFRMTLNPGRDDERVLLDIPRWDFDWQLIYEPVEDIRLEFGDVIRMECEWDRSLRDPELEPAYVIWSDGTDDEMCFASVTTRP